jgi:hypothetical protein
MLLAMQQLNAEREPSPTPASFANMLAAFALDTAPAQHIPTDDLEDDVASISHEQALASHRQRLGHSLPPSSPDAGPSESSALAGSKTDATVRKSASVTVRMSQEEFAQLQTRAAEAGLSVSAYLRSCTFEAEALRAQVKQAVAEIRANQTTTEAMQPQRLRWLRQLLPHRTQKMPSDA